MRGPGLGSPFSMQQQQLQQQQQQQQLLPLLQQQFSLAGSSNLGGLGLGAAPLSQGAAPLSQGNGFAPGALPDGGGGLGGGFGGALLDSLLPPGPLLGNGLLPPGPLPLGPGGGLPHFSQQTAAAARQGDPSKGEVERQIHALLQQHGQNGAAAATVPAAGAAELSMGSGLFAASSGSLEEEGHSPRQAPGASLAAVAAAAVAAAAEAAPPKKKISKKKQESNKAAQQRYRCGTACWRRPLVGCAACGGWGREQWRRGSAGLCAPFTTGRRSSLMPWLVRAGSARRLSLLSWRAA